MATFYPQCNTPKRLTVRGQHAMHDYARAPLPPIVQAQTVDGEIFGRLVIDGARAPRVLRGHRDRPLEYTDFTSIGYCRKTNTSNIQQI
jgi:hypothetical protein